MVDGSSTHHRRASALTDSAEVSKKIKQCGVEEPAQGLARSAPSHTAWTTAEMDHLVEMVNTDGTGAWAAKAAALGTSRTPRAVRKMYYTLRSRWQAGESGPLGRPAKTTAPSRRARTANKMPVSLDVSHRESFAPTTTRFSGIEYVQADGSWSLLDCAVPVAALILPLSKAGLVPQN